MAVVLALLVILVLSTVAMALTLNIVTAKRNTSYDVQWAKALNTAEAGVAEAMQRIRENEVPSSSNPKMVTQIYLCEQGVVPTAGTDTTTLATDQDASSWLTYSSATKNPDVLTVTFKTDAARTTIYRYDTTKNPKIQTATGDPIYVVTSTGTYGKARRTVVAEVVNDLVSANLKGATASNEDIELKEKANSNGYDYKVDTPTGTANDGNRNKTWETGRAAIPGAWAHKKVHADGVLQGANPGTKVENGNGFYSGPWDVFGMTEPEFYSWVGDANGDKKQGNPRGITYVDRPGGKPGDGKGKFEWKGGFNGDGFLYVNGDLDIKGDFTFRGLIYTEGKLTIHGAAWILGGVISKKKPHLHGKTGGVVQVLRSEDSITQNISKYASTLATISWREQ
jgi:Tfp pilus assembly protein PilX